MKIVTRCIATIAVVSVSVWGITAFADFNEGSADPRGCSFILVVTGSMDAGDTGYPISTIPTNSLALMRAFPPEDFGDVKIGDVLAYRYGDITVVHRVVSIDEEARTFTLKGDANTSTENVSFDDVLGRVVHVFPEAGQILNGIRSTNVFLLIAGGLCLIVMLFSGLDMYRVIRSEED
ncbi:MAG: hypothetical protein ACI4Q9_05745 [Candidatus Methanomethylophilaceae archaeon]